VDHREPSGVLTLKISDIKTEPPFSTLFSIGDNTLADIVKSMQVNGYDDAQPVVIWGDVLIDGHTRLKAAAQIGLEEIPVSAKFFATEDEALDYAIGRQRERRHLTDAELARCLAELDRRRTAGRPEKLAQHCANYGKSSAETAALLGISPRKVEQIRTINDHAPEEIKKALDSGEKTVNKAYKETQEYRREVKKPEEKEQPKPKYTAKELANLPPSQGLNFARLAIMNLEQIQPNDTEKDAAFQTVRKWINDRS
jgi:ParB-like chromosome segregation protein Spo0J